MTIGPVQTVHTAPLVDEFHHVRMTEDLELISRIQARDSGALSVLYDRYGGALFSMAVRVLRDPQAAEGVVQKVFLRVWRKADQYRPERGRVSTWLFTITRNLSIDVLRKRKRGPESVGEEVLEQVVTGSELADPLSEYMQGERRELVLKALGGIPREQKMAVYMAYYEGLSHREIARCLDQPLGTVKTRIQLGLSKLRQALAPHFST